MGLEILLVEDSWVVGEAVKDLLELLGAQRAPKSLAARGRQASPLSE
jgi:hypothetical protein